MGAVIEANTVSGVVLGVFVAVNSVIALYYYARIGAKMWADEAPDGDLTSIRIPASLTSALVITVAATIVFGVLPGLVGDITKVSLLAGVGG